MADERHIVRFFTRMTHLFAHKWTSIYGMAMNGESLTESARQWFHDLKDFTPEQIATGINKVEEQASDWPPTPMEFRKLCMGVPTIEEVLDRRNHYGPICGAIRLKMDWWNLDAMPTKQMRSEALQQYHQAVTNLSRSGVMHRLALTAASKRNSISDETD